MVCNLCKKKFCGKYWCIDSNNYCSLCYKSVKFKCCVCSSELEHIEFVKDGKNYCYYCYRQELKCDICYDMIIKDYYEDFGKIICTNCYNNNAKCDACNRVISHISDGGYEYSDGRKVCGICYASVAEEKYLQVYYDEVSSFMKSIGFKIKNYTTLDIELVTKKEIDTSGQCSCTKEILDEKVIEINFIIRIYYGLPKIMFCGILAHELFHVWVKINTEDNLTKFKEEGVANLCQYLYLSSLLKKTKDKEDIKFIKFIMQNLIESSDKDYGEGLRKVKKVYDKYKMNGVFLYINDNI